MQREPEDLWINEVNLSKSIGQESFIASEKDDFRQSADDILALNGLSQNFKRSARRKINKSLITAGGEIVTADDNMYSGDGATSKQIIPDKYGYGIFDVVEPLYNQAALAKIYELSAPNYSAINAKVANIVGLGYDLVPTLSVMERLESISDTE